MPFVSGWESARMWCSVQWEQELQREECHICNIRVGRNRGEGRYAENGVGKRGRVWGRICGGRNGDACRTRGTVGAAQGDARIFCCHLTCYRSSGKIAGITVSDLAIGALK